MLLKVFSTSLVLDLKGDRVEEYTDPQSLLAWIEALEARIDVGGEQLVALIHRLDAYDNRPVGAAPENAGEAIEQLATRLDLIVRCNCLREAERTVAHDDGPLTDRPEVSADGA